jgi:hypothetical protein
MLGLSPALLGTAVRENRRDRSSGVRRSDSEPGTNSSRSSSTTTASPDPSCAPPADRRPYSAHVRVVPSEAAIPERAGTSDWSEKKTDCVPGAEKGDVERKPGGREGDVAGEKPFTRLIGSS